MNRLWLSSMALALLLGPASRAVANDKVVTFGALERPDAAAVRAQVETWLQLSGKSDMVAKLDVLWQQDRSLVERVADAIALGSPAAAKLLIEARDPNGAAPVEVAPFFKDARVPVFVRANVGLAYARALSNRRVHEESLAVLKTIAPEQVVDPAAYLF